MDALDAREIKLQQTSASRLAEFETSLPRLLWKLKADGKGDSPGNVVHTLVRNRKALDMVLLLEPFQEWPQLLDPKLNSFLQCLVPAFLIYLCKHANHYRLPRRGDSHRVCPLPRAVCRILYTLCKIRGEKVILQFLNNEPKYLEPMLTAYRAWNQSNINSVDGKESDYGRLVWEERYIMLLWLSHLMLTPFDLSSISSTTTAIGIDHTILQINLPTNAPSVTKRVISASLKHLESAGKEREAARALLVRLVLRPDMLSLGLLDAFVSWALLSLESSSANGSIKTVYAHIGVLSFLAGVITSAAKNTIVPFLGSIFKSIQRINADQSPLSKAITSSVLARKIIIKILRAITILIIPLRPSVSSHLSDLPNNVLEEIIDHLLSSLADKDTPVRYAASKALSVIAVKLEPAMAADVVEAVVGSLEENLLWEDATTGQIVSSFDLQHLTSDTLRRNLTAVDALRWQGLILTLSHLLYRRSPPPEKLPSILNALILALGFEQRSSVGSSVGTNVRDAACFGIWALARRYTTHELSKIDTTTIRAANSQGHRISVLQALANEIVVAATLDSSGNIRRGASAALQELIGRHPDTIIEGISLIQVVDYHAVALRSKAIQEVATGASVLNLLYWNAIFEGLLEWRGIGSPDAPSRRVSATAIGLLTVSHGSRDVGSSLERVLESLNKTPARQVEERHGLLLSLAAIVRQFSAENQGRVVHTTEALAALWKVFDSQSYISNDMLTSSSLRPELTTEAACTLLSALANFSAPTSRNLPQSSTPCTITAQISRCTEILDLCLLRTEDIVVNITAKAVHDFFRVLNNDERDGLVHKWVGILSLDSSSKARGGAKAFGIISTLGFVFHYFVASDSKDLSKTQQTIVDGLLSQVGPGIEIESRVAAVRSLASGVLTCNVLTTPMATALKVCLSDYTTDRRGDVGSMVRVEAIDAVGVALKHNLLRDQEVLQDLVARICGLACEKLDKVRFRAWTLLQDHWAVFPEQDCPPIHFSDVSDTSTEPYFLQILPLCSLPWIATPLLRGYLSSSGAGSESLLRSSRAALVHYTEQLPTHSFIAFCKTFTAIIHDNISNDRILLPALDTFGFLFDAGIMQRLNPDSFPWLDTFNVVQKTHFRSGNVRKLEAAVHVYSGLASVYVVRKEALGKLCSLLLHSFPKIRNSAADALMLAFAGEQGNDMVKKTNWSDSAKALKPNVQELRAHLGVSIKS